MLITSAYPFSKSKHIQFLIHSGTSVQRLIHHNSSASFSSSSSPFTRQHPILDSGARSSITDTNILMDEPWQSFKMHYYNDAMEMHYDSDESDHDAFHPLRENPRIESLRRDK